ncbi:uncharacterized protein LOC106639211 [Copidosoma floridanum]|uniref:uncharacterized protein LOC106639211 n=1 Tax=Copidosoma floridanum TaxID=29053 RepID=UPI0006C98C87|nr:uncharacterized protein LOC106639211 [Copidosoma floridanum]
MISLVKRVLGIQNDRTGRRASPTDDPVLSASSYAERTSDEQLQSHGSSSLQRTSDALRLESSRSVLDNDDNEPELELDATKYPSSLGRAEPVTTTTFNDEQAVDALTSSKLIDQIDGNQIEVKPGEYYRNIVPTRSENLSGEDQGAPRGQRPIKEDARWSEPQERQLRQGRRGESTRIFSEHAPPPPQHSVSHPSGQQRQANPDIQDIITGIVKLLNGKVNVAVNSAKPTRPVQSTRINNRGPPRISDLPPIPPDFDTPGMNPPPPPPDQPSTYEKPPAPSVPSLNQLLPDRSGSPFLTGIPIPESIVPQSNLPWNRPTKLGTRRPIPVYKPQLPVNGTLKPSSDRDQIESDKTNAVLDLVNKVDHQQEYQHQKQNSEENRTRVTTSSEQANHSGTLPTATSSHKQPQFGPTRKYQSTLNTKNVMVENTLVLGGVPPLALPIPNATDNSEDSKISTSSNKAVFQTTLKVETSSSVRMIETTSTTILEPSVRPAIHSDLSESVTSSTILMPSTSTITLEPSRSLIIGADLSSSVSTPTDGLTMNIAKTSTVPSRLDQPITNSITFSKGQSSIYSYRPRPGIVLDDTLDYTGTQGLITQRPYGPPRHPSNPNTFDVVVSAIQGPGGSGTGEVRVPLNGHPNGADDILTSPVEGQGFVSIDGKRTYLNLFDNTAASIDPSKVQPQPTRTQNVPVLGSGYAVPQQTETGTGSAISPRPTGAIRRPIFHRRPTQPPVRIDTCIVGDTSTCDASQHETCATVHGVSACHCKPGFARLLHTLPCKRIVSIVVSIRVDKIYDKKVVWNKDLSDKDSENYQILDFESNRAIESAMSMTPFSDEYVGSQINNVYQGDVSQGQGGVFVNATLKLAYEPRTARQSLAGELQKHLLGVIQRRYNNIGKSALYVESPAGSISNLQDLDECASNELNDCHAQATCANTWGGFTCNCKPGLKDPHKNDQLVSGRTCLSCPTSHCNNRGTCSYQGDQMQCSCTGSFWGSQCEVDGEVLSVAIGASFLALVVIVFTLVCLIMWSRKWSREQKALSPVYGYIQGGLPGTLPARVGSVGTLASVKQGPPSNLPPYMWAQVADHLATANVYATEPMGPTRPSSAMFGYPTLSLHGTLPPVPLPRLQAPPPRARQRHHPRQPPEPDSSDSEPQDKDRADLIPQSNFTAPRPKSRVSMANQSGIYYDVEYDQGDARHLSKNIIPMSTYSGAPYYRT